MSAGKANCLICGKPLVYHEDQVEVTCEVCGKKEFGHSLCEDGHYVCDMCHREKGVEMSLELCNDVESCNPIEIFYKGIDDKSIYPNGPEHHTLIGASLLAAWCNCIEQGKVNEDFDPAAQPEPNREKMLAELKVRSMKVPGGTCGFWGTCGAATSAGQFMSIVNGSTPMTKKPWAECQQLTSNILGHLARLGGPRCCKRTGFTAILEAAEFVEETHGVVMELPEQVVCRHFHRNDVCLREECPYFPKKKAE